VAHAAKDVEQIVALLKDVACDHELIVTDIGPVVGTHGGPGIIGVCWISQ
jgi:fatty acid-binding protein DegV